MESNNKVKYFKNVQKLNKLFVLISVSESSNENIDPNNLNISIFDFEAYFKSNILLQYGILGYLGFPFKVISQVKKRNHFIIQTNIECLSKLQVIVSDSFPAQCPVKFKFNKISHNSKLKFEIIKFNTSLSGLINDDLVLNYN